jgi:hypothetical protein
MVEIREQSECEAYSTGGRVQLTRIINRNRYRYRKSLGFFNHGWTQRWLCPQSIFTMKDMKIVKKRGEF